MLFQVADDLIDYKGSLLVAGKKTGKDKKKGKATLISLLGYKNTIKYANNLILKINNKFLEDIFWVLYLSGVRMQLFMLQCAQLLFSFV